jgi:hypothetical protein
MGIHTARFFGDEVRLYAQRVLYRRNKGAFISELYAMLKKPTARIAHLVFADTRANAEKPKELLFCQR